MTDKKPNVGEEAEDGMKKAIGAVIGFLGFMVTFGGVENLVVNRNAFDTVDQASQTVGGLAIGVILLGCGLIMLRPAKP